MKKHIKPKRLSSGDTIGLIAPSSSISEEKLEKALQNMEKLGLKVKLGKYIRAKNGFLAGTDQERLEDLHAMFADDSVDGIWCIRGGYGLSRVLPFINYKLIRKNPKVLIGYSDVTALLQAVYQRTGLICFHGPVAASEFSDYTVEHIRNVLMSPSSSYLIPHSIENDVIENSVFKSSVINPGKAKGELIGGNLSLISALSGTKYDWKVKNKLVFIEDIGEKPYRIDRMLTQVLQSSDLHKAAGIILGVFLGCEAKEGDKSLSLIDTLKDRLAPLGIPIIYGMSFGHIDNQFTLPLGIEAEMDTARRTLTLLESAVF